jgi:hypothetical protein
MSRTALALSAAAVLTAVASSQASVVIATFNGANPGDNFTITTNGGTSTSQVRAGLMNWTRTGGDAPGLAPTFWTFCIEVTQNVSNNNSYTYNVLPADQAPNTAPMGLQRADLLSELFGRYISTLNFANTTQVAAFQIAIWEIVYDTGVDLLNGDFQVTGGNASARTIAQNFLNSLDGTGARVTVDALVSSNNQDQIVPTPGALALMGMGGLLASRRRRMA